jgi:hypothetical protein
MLGTSRPLPLSELTNACAAERAVTAAPSGSVSRPMISRMPAPEPVAVLTSPGSGRPSSFCAAARFSCDLATAA